MTILAKFPDDNCFVAIALIVTAKVCIPAFPPIDATIGIKNAKATICSIDAPNILITHVASNAVNKFKSNQLNLLFVFFKTLSVISSSPTPANLKTSSWASSLRTVKTSSPVIIPTNLLSLSTTPAETSENGLAEMMVGRSVMLRVDKSVAEPGDVVLELEKLSVEDDRGQIALNEVSFEVREGEILGVAGVEGNGQRELVEAITGLRGLSSGLMKIGSDEFTSGSTRQIAEKGVAHIPEDREKHGLIGVYSLEENSVLNRYHREPFSLRGFLRRDVIKRHAEGVVDEFDVRTPSTSVPASSLSGGNKQKLIVGREFSDDIDLLVAAQPTRGIDIGAIEFIHRRILDQRDKGTAVLLVSAELDEILGLSDRIAVLYDGELMDVLDAEDSNREKIGLLMAGITDSKGSA